VSSGGYRIGETERFSVPSICQAKVSVEIQRGALWKLPNVNVVEGLHQVHARDAAPQ
jgi:hypothetical protein